MFLNKEFQDVSFSLLKYHDRIRTGKEQTRYLWYAVSLLYYVYNQPIQHLSSSHLERERKKEIKILNQAQGHESLFESLIPLCTCVVDTAIPPILSFLHSQRFTHSHDFR